MFESFCCVSTGIRICTAGWPARLDWFFCWRTPPSSYMFQTRLPGFGTCMGKKRSERLQVRDFLFHETCVYVFGGEASLKLPKRHAGLKLIHFFRPEDVKKILLLPQPCRFFQQTLCSKVPRKPKVLQSLLERSDLLLWHISERYLNHILCCKRCFLFHLIPSANLLLESHIYSCPKPPVTLFATPLQRPSLRCNLSKILSSEVSLQEVNGKNEETPVYTPEG